MCIYRVSDYDSHGDGAKHVELVTGFEMKEAVKERLRKKKLDRESE